MLTNGGDKRPRGMAAVPPSSGAGIERADDLAPRAVARLHVRLAQRPPAREGPCGRNPSLVVRVSEL